MDCAVFSSCVYRHSCEIELSVKQVKPIKFALKIQLLGRNTTVFTFNIGIHGVSTVHTVQLFWYF